LQKYVCNLSPSEDFSIWNDSSIGNIEWMPINTMNIEKYDLPTIINFRSHCDNTYKNTIQDDNCILEIMKDKECFKILQFLIEK
jgi:hypothetical protein